MGKFIAVMIVSLDLLGASALAQVHVTLDQLRRELAPGDSISLVQKTGESAAGRLLRLDDVELHIRPDGRQPSAEQHSLADLIIPIAAIQTVERRPDSSRNGALIGASVGGAFAGAMFARAVAIDRNEIAEWAPIYLGIGALFTGAGALVGWAIDSAHSKPRIRFDAAATEKVELRFAPLFARGRGIRLTATF